jgi:HEAT repeat protein
MESHHKRWWIAGGSAAAVVVAGFFLLGGDDPERDLNTTNVEKRLAAISSLEQKDTPAAAQVIAKYTTDADVRVAQRSLIAIGRMRKGGDTRVIVDAMSHQKPEIREAAVAAMGTRGEKADKQSLRDRLARDPAPTVRTAAAAELGQMRDWDSVPLLVAALDDPDPNVVGTALRCLMDIGGRDHPGARSGATPAQRAHAIQSIKRDWQSFKGINDDYKRTKEYLGK